MTLLPFVPGPEVRGVAAATSFRSLGVRIQRCIQPAAACSPPLESFPSGQQRGWRFWEPLRCWRCACAVHCEALALAWLHSCTTILGWVWREGFCVLEGVGGGVGGASNGKLAMNIQLWAESATRFVFTVLTQL